MILVINAGSSNVKFALYEQSSLQQLYRSQVDTMQDVYTWLQANQTKYRITGIGHRVVHGGSMYSAPMLLSTQVIQQLKQYISLAPLHQPHNIAAIEFLMLQYPGITQIACFDTAFHTTQSALAKEFAIPAELTKAGVIRYGFHGLSYEYIASVLEERIGPSANTKVIVAHLGNGSSMCAMQELKSVATTMGFSALEGLMMGTRCGSIDPGVLLYLLQGQKFTVDNLTEFLYNKCGLAGVSNISNDMRELLSSADPKAKHAIDLYCYRAVVEFGKLLTVLQGCKALVFTGGIGENAGLVRAKICEQLAWLGVELDLVANSRNQKMINSKSSKLIISVIPTDEELIIAQHVKKLL